VASLRAGGAKNPTTSTLRPSDSSLGASAQTLE
jgi:hypothetical protein